MDKKDIIIQVLDQKRDYYISFLQRIVQTDSRVIDHGIDGGLERVAQGIIVAKLEQMNCLIDTFEPDNSLLSKYRAANPGHNYHERPNVVATFPGVGGGKNLILNGHIDTMPYGNRQAWMHDPFSGHIEDGKLFGLGSVDMKAGLISFLMAMDLIQESGYQLKGDVIFQSVVDEEGGGNGTLACLDRGYRANGAIVSEPTSMEVQTSHMGFLFYRVEVKGKSLHSSRKWQGVNAIDKAFILIQSLYDLEKKWMMEKRHPLLPLPTINIGEIHGGSAGSTVPNECYFTLCLHYLPQDADANGLGDLVEKEVLDTIMTRCDGDPWLKENRPKVVRYQEGSPFETSLPHPLVDTADKVLRSIEKDMVVSGMPAGCDARYFPTIAETPCIIVGPGNPEQAHSIDEHIELSEYLSYIEFVSRFVLDWCGFVARGLEN